MAVRGVRGGKAGAARGTGGASKASGAGFRARVERADAAAGPAGAAGSSALEATAPVDPVMGQVLSLAKQLKAGQLKSRDEATQKLIADILREKVRSQSRSLTAKVFEQLKNDPRLSQTLERLWKRAEEQE